MTREEALHRRVLQRARTGVRAIVDEKKMVKGAPSRRSGRLKPTPQ